MTIHRPAPFVVIALLAASAYAQQPLKIQPGAESPQPAKAPTKEEEQDARKALSERFYDFGLAIDRQYTSKAMLHQAEAFYAAAVVMDPSEPRFIRYLAQAKEKEGDVAGAIKAWKQYLSIESARKDEVARIDLIDLYLTQQQGNDAKIAYLKQLLASPRVEIRVKAHVAMMAVPLLDQRSRKDALEMLAEARKYYPLPEVVHLEYRMLPPDASKVQRFTALLNILRADPVHVDSIGQIADMLSEVGLSEEALIWYATFIDAHLAMQTLPDKVTLVNFIAERYRAGETSIAKEELDKDLQVDPDDPNFWFLRLTIQHSDESPQLLKEAEQAFLRRVNAVCETIVPEQSGAATRPSAVKLPATLSSAANSPATQPATTQPTTSKVATTEKTRVSATQAAASQPAQNVVTESAVPLDEAIRRAKAGNDLVLRNLLASTLYDLAWFELYFHHDAKAAGRWLAATKELTSADDVKLKRLDGWYNFVAGNDDIARAIFTAQKGSDPLSALGLFDLELKEKHDKQAEAIAQAILSEPGAGVVAAMLYEGTRGRGFKALKQPADAPAILAELQKFPREWLDVVHNPAHAYALRADPIKIGHRIGEPLLAAVLIQNVSKMDITIGNFGLIKPPLLVLDGQIRGVNAHNFPGAAIDRIMGRQVLAPGESITQIVRLDQGEFSDALRLRPGVILLINADVMTNAAPTANGFRARAGGYVRLFTRMFTRVAMPLTMDKARRDLIKNLHEGTPSDKMLDIDLLSAYIAEDLGSDADPNQKAFAQQFANLIDTARNDTAPGVKLWASYAFALQMDTPPERTKAVDFMLKSNAWESRLLGLYAAHGLGSEAELQLAKKLAADDANDLVKSYAQAAVEVLQSAATQPTTAPALPATQPSTAPAR
jgi:hypothetical protein